MFQPLFIKSNASQSSNSGCDGGSPCIPKSPEVYTMPLPKNSCHIRFTKTLEVNGCFLSNNHFANPSLFFSSFVESNGKIFGGVLKDTSSPNWSYTPRFKIWVHLTSLLSFMIITATAAVSFLLMNCKT